MNVTKFIAMLQFYVSSFLRRNPNINIGNNELRLWESITTEDEKKIARHYFVNGTWKQKDDEQDKKYAEINVPRQKEMEWVKEEMYALFHSGMSEKEVMEKAGCLSDMIIRTNDAVAAKDMFVYLLDDNTWKNMTHIWVMDATIRALKSTLKEGKNEEVKYILSKKKKVFDKWVADITVNVKDNNLNNSNMENGINEEDLASLISIWQN